MIFFMSSRFSFTAFNSQGTQHFAFDLVGIYPTAASIWVIKSFHMEYVFQISLEENLTCF